MVPVSPTTKPVPTPSPVRISTNERSAPFATTFYYDSGARILWPPGHRKSASHCVLGSSQR